MPLRSKGSVLIVMGFCQVPSGVTPGGKGGGGLGRGGGGLGGLGGGGELAVGGGDGLGEGMAGGDGATAGAAHLTFSFQSQYICWSLNSRPVGQAR